MERREVQVGGERFGNFVRQNRVVASAELMTAALELRSVRPFSVREPRQRSRGEYGRDQALGPDRLGDLECSVGVPFDAFGVEQARGDGAQLEVDLRSLVRLCVHVGERGLQLGYRLSKVVRHQAFGDQLTAGSPCGRWRRRANHDLGEFQRAGRVPRLHVVPRGAEGEYPERFVDTRCQIQ